MKVLKSIKYLMFMLAALGLAITPSLNAQTFTVLHTFDSSDGANPPGGMILSSNTFYGETYNGGVSNSGTLFAVGINGNNFTNLYDFTGGSDGANPVQILVLSTNTLYGIARDGGTNGSGSVFAIHIDGSGFTNLYSFTAANAFSPNSDGANPDGGLILSGKTLYGTTLYGGSNGIGTVYAINTDGTDFSNLHSFNGFNVNDGAEPNGGLILFGNTLYGTTFQGGSNNDGTVFAVNADGTGFTNLYSFSGMYPNGDGTNSDGAYPSAGLILSGNTLYGTASEGGVYGGGTLFAINTDGTDFTNLYNFNLANTNGTYPLGELVLSGNTLYGTTSHGGNPPPNGEGAVFAVSTNGTDFTNLYLFSELLYYTNPATNSDGTRPQSRLILSGNTLYGTTAYGGSSGVGTVFSLSLPLQLAITLSGTNVILSWPTNATNFTLQSTTNLVSSAAWITNSSAPFIVSGQYVATNPITGSQMFYRLSQSPP